eukprot:240341-Chlamydomonas_euryale.AAC.14
MSRLRQLCDPYDPATFTCVEQPATAGGAAQSEGAAGDVRQMPARQPTHHEYVAVFRKATPTFKKHALSDEAVPQDERQVRIGGSAGAVSCHQRSAGLDGRHQSSDR